VAEGYLANQILGGLVERGESSEYFSNLANTITAGTLLPGRVRTGGIHL
jgi:hypothetical protein